MLKTKFKSNIKKFYFLNFFSGICFNIPVMYLLWSNSGLSMTEIMLIQSVFSIFVVILEVPSGYFADIFGRKVSIIIGVLAWFIGISLYTVVDNFLGFLIVEILFALGISSLSGADSSFVYDSLKETGEESKYKKKWGNANFLKLLSMGLSQIVGGFIAKYGLPFNLFENIDPIRLTVWVSLPFLIIPVIISFTLYETKSHKEIVKKGYLKELFVVLKEEVLSNRKLLNIMLFFMFLGAGLQFALWFYQPYFEFIKLDIMYRGIIFGIFQIFSGIVGKFAHSIENKLGLTKTIILCTILVIASYFGMGLTFTVVGLVFTLFQQFVRGLHGIVISDYIHQKISSKYRATIQSIQSLGKSLVYALFLPFFGRMTDLYSLSQALIIIGITSFVLLIPLLIILLKNKTLVFTKSS